MTTIPKVPEDVQALADDKLEALWLETAEVREQLRLDYRRLNTEREGRIVAAAAKAKVSRLSDPERAALLQALEVEQGVETAEKTGDY